MNYKEKELLKGGIKFFGERGFEDFCVKDIEDISDMRKGTFFEVFSSAESFAKECYLIIMRDLSHSNQEYLSLINENLNFKQISRQVFFNVIAWWLNNPMQFRFFQQFTCSKYYIGNFEFIRENSGDYFSFIEYGMKKGYLKTMPENYMYDMVAGYIRNTVCYINQNPNLMGDQCFLGVAFDALWDCVSFREKT